MNQQEILKHYNLKSLVGAYLCGADLWRADLHGANLAGADLREAVLWRADLTGADLREANLTRANLTGADLTGAYLNGADLTDAKGLIDTVEWLEKNFELDSDGNLYAYKTFGMIHSPPKRWIIEKESIIEEKLDEDRRNTCSYGINVATLQWVESNNQKNLSIWKVKILKQDIKDACVPYATDGKFRVKQCQLVHTV